MKFENEVEKLIHELKKLEDSGYLEFKLVLGTYNINIKQLKKELHDYSICDNNM